MEAIKNLAIDLLDGADIAQEFDDTIWLIVDRELWEEFIAARDAVDAIEG